MFQSSILGSSSILDKSTPHDLCPMLGISAGAGSIVVSTLCSEMDSKDVEFGVADGCVVCLTVVQESLHPVTDLQLTAAFNCNYNLFLIKCFSCLTLMRELYFSGQHIIKRTEICFPPATA